MDKARTITIFGSLALVVILLLSWFLLLSPRMATANDLNLQREATAVQNVGTAARIAELEQMKANIGDTKADAEALAARFPATAAQSDLFILIREAAAKAGIPESNITDLTPGVPTLGSSDGSVTLAAPPAPAADPNAAPVAGAAAAAPAPTSQLGTMTLDVTVNGTSAQIIAFLKALENMDRSYLINSVNVGDSGAVGGAVNASATINGKMFTLPALVDPTDEDTDAADAAAETTP